MKPLISIIALVALMSTGCKKNAQEVQEEQIKAAVKAAIKATTQEEAPAKPLTGPTDAPANPLAGAAQAQAALAAMAQAGAAMQQGGKPMGKIINWRKLAPFLPEKIGDYASTKELKGSTSGMGQMQVSTVKRRYQAGDKKLKVEIIDTTLVPAMRAGFAMIKMINEDSSDGIRKGTTVAGQPALLEWRKARQRGKMTIICGERFLVNIRVKPTNDPQEVLKLAKSLDLPGLVKLKAE